MSSAKDSKRANALLAAVALGFACLVAFVWIPLDVQTGLIEQVRRRVTIGDSLAPALAAAFIALGALLLLLERAPAPDRLSLANLRFVAALILGFALAFALMRWTGPVAVWLTNAFTDQSLDYRSLRDTPPWKYLGYLLGSTALITTGISALQGRLTPLAFIVALAATLAIIAFYDLPFDDLLLPPNGDV